MMTASEEGIEPAALSCSGFHTTETPAGCFCCPVEINTRVEGYGRGCVAFMSLLAGSL